MSSTTTTTDVDALQLQQEVRKIEALARQAELNLAQRRSNAFEGRRYYLDEPLTAETVSSCIATLSQWRRLDSKSDNKHLHIYMNTSATSAIPPLALYDYIMWMRADGYRVTIEVTGECSGTAAMVLQAADVRLASPLSFVSLQELQTGYTGHTFQFEKRLEWMLQVQQQVRRLTVKRAGKKLTSRQMAARTKNTSWILSAEDAAEKGLIDRISRSICCGEIDSVLDLPVVVETDTMTERKSKALLRKLQAESELEEINVRNLETSDEHNFVYRFFTDFNTEACKDAKQAVARFAQRRGSEITMQINSPGGNVVAGFGLIGLLNQVRASGHRVVTECLGYAASMGGVTLQAGDWRVMSENSWLLIHNVSNGFWGSMSEFVKDTDECFRLQRQCFELLAERSVMTADEIFEQCRTHDWWIPARLALKLGFCDEVR